MQSDLLCWIPEQEKDKIGKTGKSKEVWTLGNRVASHPGLPGLKGSLRHGTSSFKIRIALVCLELGTSWCREELSVLKPGKSQKNLDEWVYAKFISYF